MTLDPLNLVWIPSQKSLKACEIRAEITHEMATTEVLDLLQFLVDGYIEVVPLVNSISMIVNEEGLLRNMPDNKKASRLCGHRIVGNVAVVRSRGEKFVSLSDAEIQSILRGCET